MVHEVILSEESLKEIREILGIKEGVLYLKNGKIYVKKKETISALSKKYKIESVNGKRFDKTLQLSKDKPLLADKESLSKDERYTLVGPMQIGSIVKVKHYTRVIHLVITDLYEDTFDAMSVNIRISSKDAFLEEGIILEKNTDVVYKNLTYRDISLVCHERYLGFSFKDIMNTGSRIEGRVINKSKLEEILALKEQLDKQIEEQEKEQEDVSEN